MYGISISDLERLKSKTNSVRPESSKPSHRSVLSLSKPAKETYEHPPANGYGVPCETPRRPVFENQNGVGVKNLVSRHHKAKSSYAGPPLQSVPEDVRFSNGGVDGRNFGNGSYFTDDTVKILSAPSMRKGHSRNISSNLSNTDAASPPSHAGNQSYGHNRSVSFVVSPKSMGNNPIFNSNQKPNVFNFSGVSNAMPDSERTLKRNPSSTSLEQRLQRKLSLVKQSAELSEIINTATHGRRGSAQSRSRSDSNSRSHSRGRSLNILTSQSPPPPPPPDVAGMYSPIHSRNRSRTSGFSPTANSNYPDNSGQLGRRLSLKLNNLFNENDKKVAIKSPTSSNSTLKQNDKDVSYMDAIRRTKTNTIFLKQCFGQLHKSVENTVSPRNNSAAMNNSKKQQSSNSNRNAPKPVNPDLEKQAVNSINECYYVISELVDSEHVYLDLLYKCNISYIDPIRESLDSGAKVNYKLTESDINALFSNIEQIYVLGTVLFSEMQTILNSFGTIEFDVLLCSLAILFNNLIPMFKIYTGYARNHFSSSALLETLLNSSRFSKFQKLLDNNQKSLGTTLDSLLILPIQRIPRYKLLLEELVKKMNKIVEKSEQWFEAEQLFQTALDKLDECALDMNKAIESRQDGEILVKLQEEFGDTLQVIVPGRKFIRRQFLYLMTDWKRAKKVREGEMYEFLLFSDLLVFVQSSGFFSKTMTVFKVRLESDFVCHEVMDQTPNTEHLPLLHVGLPTNKPYASFGKPPLIIQFPNRESLITWYQNILDVIRNRPNCYAERIHQSIQYKHPDSYIEKLPANRMLGYLYKLKVGHGFGSFKKRFCVFDHVQNQTMAYYKSEDDFRNNDKPCGSLSFRGCYLDIAPKDRYERPFCFELICPDLECTYAFGCKTEIALWDWISFILVSSKLLESEPFESEQQPYHVRNASRISSKSESRSYNSRIDSNTSIQGTFSVSKTLSPKSMSMSSYVSPSVIKHAPPPSVSNSWAKSRH